MARENEYQNFTIEELNSKANRYKKLQMGVMVMSVIFSAIIALFSFIKGINTGYQIIPLLLLTGIIYPLLTFGSMRKKILKEIESRHA